MFIKTVEIFQAVAEKMNSTVNFTLRDSHSSFALVVWSEAVSRQFCMLWKFGWVGCISAKCICISTRTFLSFWRCSLIALPLLLDNEKFNGPPFSCTKWKLSLVFSKYLQLCQGSRASTCTQSDLRFKISDHPSYYRTAWASHLTQWLYDTYLARIGLKLAPHNLKCIVLSHSWLAETLFYIDCVVMWYSHLYPIQMIPRGINLVLRIAVSE